MVLLHNGKKPLLGKDTKIAQSRQPTGAFECARLRKLVNRNGTPNISKFNFFSSIESCDFDELSKELNRWRDALHNDYIRWQMIYRP